MSFDYKMTAMNAINNYGRQCYEQGRADQLKEDAPHFAMDIDDKTELKIRADERAKAVDDFLDLLYFNFNVNPENKKKIAKLAEQIKHYADTPEKSQDNIELFEMAKSSGITALDSINEYGKEQKHSKNKDSIDR